MKNKTTDKFHAVEFMRETRKKLSKLYLENKEKYFEELENATKEFLKTRSKKSTKKAA